MKQFSVLSIRIELNTLLFMQDGQDAEQAGESEDETRAAEAKLERIFEKSSFTNLDILGQFNLGFILARLGNDLFIIDQHASDEKFNFERLTKTTQLNRQPLLAPQRLDLTPAESIIVRSRCASLPHMRFQDLCVSSISNLLFLTPDAAYQPRSPLAADVNPKL